MWRMTWRALSISSCPVHVLDVRRAPAPNGLLVVQVELWHSLQTQRQGHCGQVLDGDQIMTDLDVQ